MLQGWAALTQRVGAAMRAGNRRTRTDAGGAQHCTAANSMPTHSHKARTTAANSSTQLPLRVHEGGCAHAAREHAWNNDHPCCCAACAC
jgi:microcystin-dependent protein